MLSSCCSMAGWLSGCLGVWQISADVPVPPSLHQWGLGSCHLVVKLVDTLLASSCFLYVLKSLEGSGFCVSADFQVPFSLQQGISYYPLSGICHTNLKQLILPSKFS